MAHGMAFIVRCWKNIMVRLLSEAKRILTNRAKIHKCMHSNQEWFIVKSLVASVHTNASASNQLHILNAQGARFRNSDRKNRSKLRHNSNYNKLGNDDYAYTTVLDYHGVHGCLDGKCHPWNVLQAVFSLFLCQLSRNGVFKCQITNNSPAREGRPGVKSLRLLTRSLNIFLRHVCEIIETSTEM